MGTEDVRWIKYRIGTGDMPSNPRIPSGNARVKVCSCGPGCSPWLVTHSIGKENIANSGTGHSRTQVFWAGSPVCVAGSASRSSMGRSWGHTLKALKAMVSL